MGVAVAVEPVAALSAVRPDPGSMFRSALVIEHRCSVLSPMAFAMSRGPSFIEHFGMIFVMAAETLSDRVSAGAARQVMNDVIFPERLDFGVHALGETVCRVVKMVCKVCCPFPVGDF